MEHRCPLLSRLYKKAPLEGYFLMLVFSFDHKEEPNSMINMDELIQEQNIQPSSCLLLPDSHDRYKKHAKDDETTQWTIMDGKDDDYDTCSTSSSLDISSNSTTSTSSSDMVDDDDASSSCSSSISNGPLYELPELMANLPIKRGLSKYYQGKSQSYASLSRVTNLEDLAKKETPYSKRIKASKSCGNGLDGHKLYTLSPRATISKKVSRTTTPLSSLSFPNRRGSFLTTSRPPLVPLQKKL